jgi:flagellin
MAISCPLNPGRSSNAASKASHAKKEMTMSSMLTNTGSMVALQTLRGVNSNMSKVQSEISTGLKVASAKDNSSVWAIAATMQSDVGGFEQLADSLAVGNASVGVARNGAEAVKDLLSEMKEKIVAAQDPTADAAKLQTDINELRNQIGSVVSSAQFNGLNLLDGSNASINVLASLDRDSTGAVTASNITVAGQDLQQTVGGAVVALTGSTGVNGTGDAAAFALNANAGTGDIVVIDTPLTAGDVFSVGIDDLTFSYEVTAEDVASTNTDIVVATKIMDGINALGIDQLSATTDDETITLTNTATGTNHAVSIEVNSAGTGGLADLAGIDVTVDPTGALADIEGLITTAINSAAALGSSQKRIEIQQDFIGKLIDSAKTGIGAMVDANMEEASARLTALQTQQQLGIQSLSIANSAPQNILSLFRG